jgi:hypothetical protein
MRVGYQGQSGAYSSIVIDQLFGHVAKEGQRTLSDLFSRPAERESGYCSHSN